MTTITGEGPTGTVKKLIPRWIFDSADNPYYRGGGKTIILFRMFHVEMFGIDLWWKWRGKVHIVSFNDFRVTYVTEEASEWGEETGRFGYFFVEE